MRSQFTFYKSFDDIMEDLTDKQIAQYIKALLDVQFLRVRIEDVKFEDKVLSIVWKSQKHSIQKSIDGYLASQKNSNTKEPFMGVYEGDNTSKNTPSEGGFFTPSEGPSEGGRQQEQEQEQEQDKEKEKEELTKEKKEKEKKFSFALKRESTYENLSKEYKEKLKAKCLMLDGNIERYEEFILQLEAKGYKYKNFVKAYLAWDKEKRYKDFKPAPEPKLGDDWVRVKISWNEFLAINTKTLETKEGRLLDEDDYFQEFNTPVETTTNRRVATLVGKSYASF